MTSINRITKDGYFHSVEPCTAFLTFAYWIYMVPQYKPKSVLILGYSGGATAGLIRLLYGNDIPITGVDINDCENKYNVNLVKMDGKEYVKTCNSFDSVIIDMFDGNRELPFIFTPEFAGDILRISSYVIINTVNKPDLSVYDERFEKIGSLTVGIPHGGGVGVVHYYKKRGLELDLFLGPRSDVNTLRF